MRKLSGGVSFTWGDFGGLILALALVALAFAVFM
jgi:hypothetical protein